MSRRSSLSALSLAAATAVRPITSKEQKEKENSTKGGGGGGLSSADSLKLRKEAVRHHLDRTTGSSERVGVGPFAEWTLIMNFSMLLF